MKDSDTTDFLLDIDDEDVSREQVKEDWNVHFNDLTYNDGPYKVVQRGGIEPQRFHEKEKAIELFDSIESNAILISGERILSVK